MAISHKWVGGATKVIQVDETIFSVAKPVNAETTTYTFTDENNTAHVKIHTFTGSPADIEAGRDQLLTALQAVTDAEFQKVTFSSSGTDTILITAKEDGRPFHLVVTESAAWTMVDNDGGSGNSVANAGPNAWGTKANWETASGGTPGALPVTNDNVLIAEGSDDILYDLVQTGINLSTLKRNPNFTGTVGDQVGAGTGTPYPLRINVNGSGAKKLSNDGRAGGGFFWTGTCPNVLWTGGLGGQLAMQIGGDVDNFRAIGPGCAGRVKFIDSMTLDNVFAAQVASAILDLGISIQSLDLIDIDSGSLFSGTNPIALKASGTAFVEISGDENVTGDWEVRGARVLYTGEGNLATPSVWFQTSGQTLLRPRSTINLFDVTVLGGDFSDKDANGGVTYDGTVTNYGGQANVHVAAEAVAQD